jgi:membrane protein implicated in regulation of membrane protease activity
MHWLKAAIGEIYGLFVDDGHFALAILVWLLLLWLVVGLLPGLATWGGIVFFLGLVAILLVSARRSAHR